MCLDVVVPKAQAVCAACSFACTYVYRVSLPLQANNHGTNNGADNVNNMPIFGFDDTALADDDLLKGLEWVSMWTRVSESFILLLARNP